MKIALTCLLSFVFATESAHDQLQNMIIQIDNNQATITAPSLNPESLAFTHAYKNKELPTTEVFVPVDVSTYFKYNACRTYCYRKYCGKIEKSKF